MAETNIKDVKLKIGTETQFQSKLKDLPINTLVGTTDPIQEGELDTSIINKLNKADNALPKPTNDTTGSAGQVLKKTANGSEWGDAPSGGGKLYLHYIFYSTGDIPVYLSLWSSSIDKLTTVDKLFEYYQVPQYQDRRIPCSCGGVSTNKIGVLTLDYLTGMSKTAEITYTDIDGIKTVTLQDNFTDVVTEA